jgi:hypothetical protein
MADSPFKGLLYSPEVLGGIGLLTAGLSGQNPGAALPMIQQGMKTASMFQAMEEEEEKRKFKKLYADSVPKEDKPLFNFAPVEYIKNREFKKPQKPNFVTLKSPDGKDIRSLNLSNPNDQTTLEQLLKENYTEFKQNVTSTDVSGLSKGTKTKVEKELQGADKLLGQLQATQAMFKDEFLTVGGKIRYQKLLLLDKANIPLNQDDAAYLRSYSTWDQNNLQYFNQYRKEITGVAAGEKEIAWLEASIPSSKDTQTTYRAKMKNQIRIQTELLEKAKAFKESGGTVYKINDKGEKVYSEGFGKYLKNKIKPSGEYLNELFISYKVDYNYKPEQAIQLMNIQFPNQNWEEILQKYIAGKTGGAL